MLLTNRNVVEIFNEGPSLLDFLPYADEKEGVFIQVDGSLGKVWELGLPGCELASSEVLGLVSSQLAGMISTLSPRLCGQVILWSDCKSGRLFKDYLKLTGSEQSETMRLATEAKVEHMENVVRPRQLRVFLTMRYFPQYRQSAWPGMARMYLSGNTPVPNDSAVCGREEFVKMLAPLENGLSAAGFNLVSFKRNDLVVLLYRILNPRHSLKNEKCVFFDGFIRDQILYNAPKACGSGFMMDSCHTRVVTLKELPAKTWPGMFAGTAGGLMPVLDACREFMLVCNFIVPDQSAALSRIKFQKSFAFVQRTSSLGDISEEAVHKKEELSQIISESFKGGRSIVYSRMHVVPFADTAEDAERAADSIAARMNAAGADCLKEEIIAPSLFLSCLPLNFDQACDQFVRRTRRLLADNFSDMLPVYGAFRGTRTPAAMYLNRRNEPAQVDFFDADTNPHAVIIGASGAGKSFFTNDLIYQNYRLGSYFFVLDKGHSYRKTCEVLDGQYVSFEMDAPLCINPFFRKPSAENRAFLVDMLAMMASGGDERDRLGREERGVLQLAISRAYELYPDREVVLSDVVDLLKTADDLDQGMMTDIGRRLALRLMPFTRQGQYGQFFDGPNRFSSRGRFTVFELAQLSRYPDLQLVVLLNIMFYISNFVAEEDMVARRKYLIIDEAWQLLKMSNTADFIANAFKTFRKYRCSAVAVTQEAADLLQQQAGSAVLANTANKIFLKQDPSLLENFKVSLSLNDDTLQLLKSLQTVKGQYSEALVITPSASGVVRLVPDPFLYWAANTEPRNNEYLKSVQAKMGQGLLAALQACAREYPYGLR